MKDVGEAIGFGIVVVIIAGLYNVQGLITNIHALMKVCQ